MSHRELSGEHRLLLYAAGVLIDPAAKANIHRLVTDGLDWALVTRAAIAHGIAPLVFRNVVDAGRMSPDDPRLSKLRSRALANAANSLILGSELVEVLRDFQRAGITAMAYKGPALATLLYGDLALREFTDLDLIVTPADVSRSGAALRALGYEPELNLSADDERSLVASRRAYFLRFDRRHAAGRVALELHWRIPTTFSLGDGFWLRRQTIRVLGEDTHHFAAEDLLLVLCAHGFKHGWSQLKWLCDLREMLRSSADLDWDRTIDRADRAGGLRVLLVGCALAEMLLGAELHPAVRSKIRADRAARSLAERFRRRYPQMVRQVGPIDNLRVRQRPIDRLRYLRDLTVQLTVPSVEERAARPAWPGAAIVVLLSHPFRLIARKWRKR